MPPDDIVSELMKFYEDASMPMKVRIDPYKTFLHVENAANFSKSCLPYGDVEREGSEELL